MIISHKHRFIFFCNGKTGTTSIDSVLNPFDEGVDFNHGAPRLWHSKHMPPVVAKAMLPPEIWREYFKFVFVRHPLDWAVSQYKFNFRRPPAPRPTKNPVKFIKRRRRYMGELEEWRARDRSIIDAPDIEYLYSFLRRYRGLPMERSLFQQTYSDSVEGEQIVDYIGRFESFSNSVRHISDQLGLELSVPTLNISERGSVSDTLTPDAVRCIRDLWKTDFDRFGYE